jgi:hypothetical protein
MVLLTSLNAQKRAMVQAEKGDLLHGLGHAVGRGRVSIQLNFSLPWGIT